MVDKVFVAAGDAKTLLRDKLTHGKLTSCQATGWHVLRRRGCLPQRRGPCHHPNLQISRGFRPIFETQKVRRFPPGHNTRGGESAP